jgi:hypothetical protein
VDSVKRLLHALLFAFAACQCDGSFSAEPRFIKVSDHAYYLQLKDSGENVAVVATDEGALMVNPPPEPDLTLVMNALKNVTSKPVRWVTFTEPRFSQNADPRFYAEPSPVFLGSAKLRTLSAPGRAQEDSASAGSPLPSWLIFERQMHLFPSNVEIRIIAVQANARTGGDVFVFAPAEKVLIVGALYEAARYPDIEMLWNGSAVGWFDGMKQVIDSVPVLKAAIPQVKSDPKLPQDKTVEEGITVISAHGDPSNLQNMKDLLDSSKKLRNDISRAVKIGRSRESFFASPASIPYRSYANFVPFATELFTEVEPAPPNR